MKSIEKWIVVSLVAGFVLGAATMVLVTSSCNLGGDSGGTEGTGGSGADFDATQYYTKNEVDSLISTVVQNSGEDYKSLTGVDFSGGVSFTVPSSSPEGVLIEIIAAADATDRKFYMTCGQDTAGGIVFSQFTLKANSAYNTYLGYSSIPSGATTITIWHSTIHANATSNLGSTQIQVKPVAWFR